MYILFINVVTKPRKSGYENKARYRVRTWNIGDMMISRYTMTSLALNKMFFILLVISHFIVGKFDLLILLPVHVY